ncbi:dihydrodipicolinate synthase family protein [Paenibacillus lentus]|uniref:Dihydrodipicolinate synthase family protein n=1 Tax=Paenibacillus lentus TaxID=1338368 RepID=A0A3Q8S9M7_9BACL|nr:dihydrodipicolinate synthase family protein [Paenibacillus lentus]AZK45631.1 dihydrodipicolinate synthase family protein [Paenibacillus lentus]
MDTDFIRGVIPPIVTPVDDNERLDEQSFRCIVDHVIEGGVHGILALGSNGEFFGLDPEDLGRVVAVTVEQSAGRVPVYAGIAAISTREGIRQARLYEELGAQAISILPPMFVTPTENELFHHFKKIAEATSLPILLYNNPDKVGNNISPGLLERLVEVPNIVGMKDSSGDQTLTAEFIRRTRDKGFKVLAGRDIMILSTLVYGGVGCVASTANVVPRLVVEIYDKYMDGDIQGALEAQYRLAPLRMAWNLGSFPVATKDAVNLIGLKAGKPILPNTSCSEENLSKIRTILKDMQYL